jgi:hypothetical protein
MAPAEHDRLTTIAGAANQIDTCDVTPERLRMSLDIFSELE